MDLGEGGGTPFLPGRHPEKIQLTSAEESGGAMNEDDNKLRTASRSAFPAEAIGRWSSISGR
jgi:hypothetical protein